MSEQKEKEKEKRVDDGTLSGDDKHRQAAGPGKVIDQKVMNRGKPGSDELHSGQSPQPRTDGEGESLVQRTGAQKTVPDPHYGSSSTAPRKPGAPTQPNSPPENADADEGAEEDDEEK